MIRKRKGLYSQSSEIRFSFAPRGAFREAFAVLVWKRVARFEGGPIRRSDILKESSGSCDFMDSVSRAVRRGGSLSNRIKEHARSETRKKRPWMAANTTRRIADNVLGYPKSGRRPDLSAARRDPAHSNIPICAGFARTEQMRRSRMFVRARTEHRSETK